MPRLNLPSPRRTVNKGVTVCLGMGYTEDQALHLIMAACSGAMELALDLGEVDLAWLAAVYTEAGCRHARLTVRRPHQ